MNANSNTLCNSTIVFPLDPNWSKWMSESEKAAGVARRRNLLGENVGRLSISIKTKSNAEVSGTCFVSRCNLQKRVLSNLSSISFLLLKLNNWRGEQIMLGYLQVVCTFWKWWCPSSVLLVVDGSEKENWGWDCHKQVGLSTHYLSRSLSPFLFSAFIKTEFTLSTLGSQRTDVEIPFPSHRRIEIQGTGSFVYSWRKVEHPVTCSNVQLVIWINHFFKFHVQILNLGLFQLHIREPSAEKNHPPFQNNLAENLHRETSKILP